MENIKKLIKERAVLRTTSTKLFRKLSERNEFDDSGTAEVRLLEEKQQRLSELDNAILSLLLETDTAEEDIQREVETADLYKFQVFSITSKFEKQAKESQSSSKSTIACQKPQLKLPEIKLVKFNGDIRNWISFWGQFQKIHLDTQIDDHDKFQYLLGAIPEDTPARSLIESFPPSAKNYPKAIEHLVQRFGREDLLIEVYMRDLLSLVLLQAKKQITSLSLLYDKLTTQLRALESMGLTSDKYAVMLYPLVESALPEELLRIWERELSRGTFTSEKGKILNNLLEFLKQEVESGQRISLARGSFNEEIAEPSPTLPTTSCFVSGPTDPKNNKLSSQKVIDKCIWCDKQWHSSMQCSKAATLSLDERRSHIKKLKICANCLKMGHNSFKCRMFIKCLACLKRHNVLFCPDLAKINKSTSDFKVTDNNETSLTSNLSPNKSVTLLQTLLVKVIFKEKEFVVRALIDSGAQRSYIKRNLAQKIGLPIAGEQNVSHIVFGGTKTNVTLHKMYNITVSNLNDSFRCVLEVLDEAKICGDIPRVHECDILEKLWKYGVTLTDVGRHTPEIEILIGADYCGLLLNSQIIQLDNGLTAVSTKLGWTLQGSQASAAIGLVTTSLHVANLWDLDVLGIKDPAETKTQEVIEAEVMEKFKKTIFINNDLRYEVKLPWKACCDRVLNNREVAEKRLRSTTKRLTNIGYYEQYDKVFKEWEEKGIIEEVLDDAGYGHYLAHHPVIKISSATTPVRPVFDASSKDACGNSLNTCLEKGVNLLELIPKILIQFRLNPVGVTADIEKAFLQISLNEDDRHFLKFLWWNTHHGSRHVKIYRHCRVVFGLTCSPFLLGATIKHHLDNSPPELKKTAEILSKSFYVDNCVLSLDENEVGKFVAEAKEVMNKGQFNLREWVIAPIAGNTPLKSSLSVLGVTWNTHEDVINININMPSEIPAKITRRALLSITQRVFDPIGFTAPCTLIPKLLMQRTWHIKGGWDDELPEHIAEKFGEWWEQTHYLQKCHIPRRLVDGTKSIASCKFSLHIFSDASITSYATCIFLRSESDGRVSVQLVLAKSRVAPTNQKVTIPRLELLAALIATRLCTQVKNSLGLNCPVYYWTDSTVVLTWIKGGTWAVFVQNRVKEIRENSNVVDWNFVPGSMNPADLPSRGCDAKTLLKSVWWEGPQWLYLDKTEWPQIVCEDDRAANNELRKADQVTELTACTAVPFFTEQLLYFSQYSKTLRMLAWVLRFVNNSSKQRVTTGTLTCSELEIAEKRLYKLIQEEMCIENKTKINMSTIRDEEGLLRVHTKLLLSDEPDDFKWPIVLPGKHPLVERLVRQKHQSLCHAGVNTLMTVLRETVWIVGIRNLAKKIVASCVKCRRYKAKPGSAPVAPLPKNRVNCNAAAFEICGIDYAGPLILKSKEKAYIVLFTCAVYRAVHLELTTSLTTNAFLMALRRFIARRGRVSVIYTDNGTNFVGASNLLKGINWSELQTSTEIQPIKWIFNPPSAAWWGGWWERLVRSIKELFRRVLGRAVVTYIELETILCDCEAVINSRPLTYVTESEILTPITPNNFLQSLPRNEIPEVDLINAKSLNQRNRYVQKLRQDLRQRFRSEYMSSLVQRGRESVTNPLEEGDVVLIETPEKRVNWPLGVVMQIHGGRDGFGRVATVKTSTGVLTRPIQRLYPLEQSSRLGGCSE